MILGIPRDFIIFLLKYHDGAFTFQGPSNSNNNESKYVLFLNASEDTTRGENLATQFWYLIARLVVACLNREYGFLIAHFRSRYCGMRDFPCENMDPKSMKVKCKKVDKKWF